MRSCDKAIALVQSFRRPIIGPAPARSRNCWFSEDPGFFVHLNKTRGGHSPVIITILFHDVRLNVKIYTR